MAAHLPRFPVLLFFFLAVHVAAAHGDPAQPQATYDASICSSSLCGSVNIRYPFYICRKRVDYSGNSLGLPAKLGTRQAHKSGNPGSCFHQSTRMVCESECEEVVVAHKERW